jgi:DNA-binding beta-propeller fold protein YncE
MKTPTLLTRPLAAIACAASLLAGCVGTPVQPEKEKAASGPVFYPQLPNAPRVQYLTTIASERDLAVTRDSFADFIVGEDKGGQKLTQPYGVAMYRGKIYVADTGAGAIAIFDMAQHRFSFMTGPGGGRLKRPINVRIDHDGTKYVTDTGREQVLVYDGEDRFLRAYGAVGEFRPVDVAIVGERLYVTDIEHHQVHVLDKRTGKSLFKFGKAGSAEGELFHPTSIALAPDGDLYVVETSNYRVQRFTQEGKPVRVYGEVGTAPGSFARPKGIAFDRSGRMLVGDAAFQNVQMFDKNGRLLMFFGEAEDGTEGVNLPAGVSVDYENVATFRRFADPRFDVEYLILVASQFGPNKVDVFGFGKMKGMDYSIDDKPVAGPRS